MNAIPDLPSHVLLAPDFDALLAPLSADAPCGPPIRHDAVFTEIRLLREEDDPNLPMGQWERPLKRADWSRIEHLCTTILTTRSKDLQLALWLAEAWTRQRGFAGLADGLQLTDGLLRRYWTTLHPLVGDDGDNDARLAPLEWLNGALSSGVRLHAPLFTVEWDKPVGVTLAVWERMAALEMAGDMPAGAKDKEAAPPQPPTRAAIHAALDTLQPLLAQTWQTAGASLAALRSIAAFLHAHLHDDAPNLGKLDDTLEAVLRVLVQFQPDPPQGVDDEADMNAENDDVEVPHPAGGADVAIDTVPPNGIGTAQWRNRRDAYRTLEALADYLGDVEPHSPTPFLLRRAASWGRMSLPEVIADIIREEGDVARLFQVLGMKV